MTTNPQAPDAPPVQILEQRAAPAAATAEVSPRGRPRVFGVAGRALPLSLADTPVVETELEVALLMTPPPNEPFTMRAPRGCFGAGRTFVLRCPGLEDPRGLLARSVTVTELAGIHFDLVTAQILEPESPGPKTPAPHTPSAHQRAQPVPAPDVPDVRQSRPPLQLSASASAIRVEGISTIDGDVGMTLTTPVVAGANVTLLAPRASVVCGAHFALRYFDLSGARRALVRAQAVHPKPGMLDEIEGVLLRPPTRAEERQSYRAPFRAAFRARSDGAAARDLVGQFIDLSASGVGFRASTQLAPGTRLTITDPSLPELDGRELEIVRIDARDAQRYGGHFLDPDGGSAALASILGVEHAEREHRRHLEIEAARRSRQALATPLTAADSSALRNLRMQTRMPNGTRADRHR